MIYFGILITLLGFVLSLASVAVSSSVLVRLVVVLIGIGISLFGIMGLLNREYLKNAIWRKA